MLLTHKTKLMGEAVFIVRKWYTNSQLTIITALKLISFADNLMLSFCSLYSTTLRRIAQKAMSHDPSLYKNMLWFRFIL